METFERNFLRLILYFTICTVIFPTITLSQAITFDDSDPDTMIVSNGTSYSLGFLKKQGALVFIKSSNSDTWLASRTLNGNLWSYAFTGDPQGGGHYFNFDGENNQFTYNWDETENMLSLSYGQYSAESDTLLTWVTFSFSAGNYFDMQIKAKNKWDEAILRVAFPQMTFDLGEDTQAITPQAYPGVLMGPQFFKEKRGFGGMYPVDLHASFMAVKTKGQVISLYSLLDNKNICLTATGTEPCWETESPPAHIV